MSSGKGDSVLVFALTTPHNGDTVRSTGKYGSFYFLLSLFRYAEAPNSTGKFTLVQTLYSHNFVSFIRLTNSPYFKNSLSNYN